MSRSVLPESENLLEAHVDVGIRLNITSFGMGLVSAAIDGEHVVSFKVADGEKNESQHAMIDRAVEQICCFETVRAAMKKALSDKLAAQASSDDPSESPPPDRA